MSTNEEAMPWALTPAQSKEVADRQVAKALAKFAEENGGGPGGPLLKFKKDEHFVLGADKVPEGTEYIAFPQEVRKGWSKFEDKKLVEEKSGKPVLGFVLPERDELGDNDPKKWPKNAAGQPTDPWVKAIVSCHWRTPPRGRSSSSCRLAKAASARSPHCAAPRRGICIVAIRAFAFGLVRISTRSSGASRSPNSL